MMVLSAKFKTLAPDMSPIEVEALLGAPHEIDDTTVPLGSGWGLQDSLKHKIHAGEPVLQWSYFDEEHDHVAWFAKPQGEWLLTLRLSLPRGLASDRDRA